MLLRGTGVIRPRYAGVYARTVVGSDGEQHAVWGAVLATVGALVTVVGTFLPWLRSGARNRSSYTIFDLVERLGFAPGGMVAWSLRLWAFVPLLLVVVAVGAWSASFDARLRRPLLATSIVAAIWVGGTSIAVMAAPEAGLFRIGPGPAVTLAGVLGAAAGGLASARVTRRGSGSSAGA